MRKSLMLMACVGFLMSLSSAVFAAYSPAEEAAWLASQGYPGVKYIGVKWDNLSGKTWTGGVPAGANLAIVKGGANGDDSMKIVELTAGGSFTFDSGGLVNNGGQQPDISHISFFEVELGFWIDARWLAADETPYTDVAKFNDEMQVKGRISESQFDHYGAGPTWNAVPYFRTYYVSQYRSAEGFSFYYVDDSAEGVVDISDTAEEASVVPGFFASANLAPTVVFVNIENDVTTKPEEEPVVVYGKETAVALPALNFTKFATAWQFGYMTFDVAKLTSVTVPVIAGQHYKVGEVTISKDAKGNVTTSYVLYDGVKIADDGTCKVGISAAIGDGKKRGSPYPMVSSKPNP